MISYTSKVTCGC